MVLEVENLNVSYRGTTALEKVSFSASPGEMVGVIGPNGGGKSTLVKAILGLVPIGSGRVKFRNRAIKKQLCSVAYVPQRTQIDWDYPITVWNVVMMARTLHTRWLRKPSRESHQIVKSALERVGMLKWRSRQIGELSGGQQQRVFLARALAQQAELFLFDEPFSGVDKATESVMYDVFAELKQNGKLLMVITHDLGVNLTKCDSLLLLNKQIIANGSFKQVITAENIQTAYGGSVLLFTGEEVQSC
ncbi:MAG: metal ABC transporter ATP-binding protein [Calothrix sp. MO_192.B10]|nr:metal ABC transporter ATP-binding protein [Calothrix sp. MO_192.B10]